jgi:LPXTG-site transpeptidase (sortase) family protein
MSAALRKVKNKPNQVTLKKILKDEKKRIRLFLLISGITLLTFGFFSSRPLPKQVQTDSNIQVSSFLQEPVNVDKALLTAKTNKFQQKNPPVRIIIPDLNIDLPVKEAKVVKGYWEVFPDSAGFGIGSSYPDEVGNQVVFAHARKDLFLPLKSAKVSQLVYVMTKDKWYSYKIETIKEVLPTQTEVIAPTKEITLTLYTCTGFSDNKRLIVIAKKS